MIVVVDDEVHTREPDHLMQLMTPFVDAAALGHECGISLPRSCIACEAAGNRSAPSVSGTYGATS